MIAIFFASKLVIMAHLSKGLHNCAKDDNFVPNIQRMNFKKLSISLIALSTLAISVVANVNDLPVKTVNGKQYRYYTVESKETLYSISKKLGISSQEIIKFNPSVADGLKAHQDLLFPFEANSRIQSPSSEVVADVVANTYEVKRGDTVYGLCRKFGISREEFLALNPDAIDGLKAGETVRLHKDAPVSRPSVAQETYAPQPAPQEAYQQPAQEQPAAPAPKEQTYTIKEGETLYHIARTHGTTVENILRANPELDVTD